MHTSRLLGGVKVDKTSVMNSAGGKIEVSPAIAKEMKQELEKLEMQYGGGSGVDMTSFPTFKFKEPKLDLINKSLAK
ncbi:unnamed protein product [Spodoptera littoralis]|uniref:ATP synthase-coupling factor 6, mitochondrial n=1 Tax=Spodoptera littoralis TaxID=7109 RepID=A0A9P0N458_SPOLI|nr:unnamed protein product [Spodoptera littoralis]CAH1641792.1 unnamed protein product [Spodoptera littoralis]